VYGGSVEKGKEVPIEVGRVRYVGDIFVVDLKACMTLAWIVPPRCHFAEAIQRDIRPETRLKRHRKRGSISQWYGISYSDSYNAISIHIFDAPTPISNKTLIYAFFHPPPHHQYQPSSSSPPSANTPASPSSPSPPSSPHSPLLSSYTPSSSPPWPPFS